MKLASLFLKNFRSCRETTVDFSSELSVLVGENASGKSAIIDALRLMTFPASGHQNAWFSADRDLSNGALRGTPVEISARYGDLSDDEKSLYLAELVDPHDDLVYNASFSTSPETPRRNVMQWSVGDLQVTDPEPALRRRIAHVYLPPLRDAVRDLDGTDQTQLHQVMRLLTDGDEQQLQEFTDGANQALQEIAALPLTQKAQQEIGNFFTQTVPPNRHHSVGVSQRELELRRLTRLLRIQLTEANVPLGDIAATGLGYANLLYISMIVLQLVKAKENDLTLLLVEEPEAHLHPQLQLVLLRFLREQAEQSQQEREGTGPAGKVQIIVTTHSPVLASAVSVKNITVIARQMGQNGSWHTTATALGSIGLEDKGVRKIDRYLNATRSTLLFARDVILVEGIAEMLLLPSLAELHLKLLENSAVYLRQFASVSLVSVEGVDFEPYLRLLLSGEYPRVDRVVVITDRDHTGAGDKRKENYKSTFQKDIEAKRLFVFVGETTLEAEMFRDSNNENLLKKAFSDLHPNSAHRWEEVARKAENSPDERAEIFAQAIRKKSSKSAGEPHLDIGKGDFSHLMAEAINQGSPHETITVPDYLKQAIEVAAYVEGAG